MVDIFNIKSGRVGRLGLVDPRHATALYRRKCKEVASGGY
jgi:hypothetical protein